MDGGGLHSTGFDVIPLYVDAANPTTQTQRSGNWADPGVWTNGVPDAISDALINKGHNVKVSGRISQAIVDDLQVNGSLLFSMYGNARLAVKTLTVFGALEVGTAAKPITGTAEVVFRDAPIDAAFDPQQFGHGLLVIDGELTAYGGTFRSENPAGVRGHIMLTGDTDAAIHDAVFRDLGRTTIARLDSTHLGPSRELLHLGANQIGRYTLHAHHAYGDVEIVDSVFDDGRRWAIALHDTDNAVVSGNVITRFDGAGIAIEDGTETGNVIKGNTISLIRGSGEGTQGRTLRQADPLGIVERRDIINPTLWGDGTPENPYRTLSDLGHEGAGIWSRSTANHYRDNVIHDVSQGIVLWPRFNLDQSLAVRGLQLGHDFSGNYVHHVGTAYGLHGVAEFTAINNDADNVRGDGFNFQYGGNVTIIGSDLNVADEGIFINEIPLLTIDDSRIISARVGAQIERESVIRNSYFQAPLADIIWQTTLPTLENVTFSDSLNNLVYKAR
jgi:parallel beta-helix repeat protein